MQFALPNTSSGRSGIVPGEMYKSEHWWCSIEGTLQDVPRTKRGPLTISRDGKGPAPVSPFVLCGIISLIWFKPGTGLAQIRPLTDSKTGQRPTSSTVLGHSIFQIR